nr:hypothetical protein [uncultured Campylobacter sp.]
MKFKRGLAALNLTSPLALLKFDTPNLSVKFTANGLKFEIFAQNLPSRSKG